MSDLKELIKEVEAAEKNGQRFTCAFSDSRTATRATNPANSGGVAAQWRAAVEAEMTNSRCSKAKATALVVRRNPALRERLVAQANNGRTPTAQHEVRMQRQPAVAQFNVELERLMESGLTKLQAAKQLSQRMGLSRPADKPFVSSPGQYR